jgi:hypothetical protein
MHLRGAMAFQWTGDQKQSNLAYGLLAPRAKRAGKDELESCQTSGIDHPSLVLPLGRAANRNGRGAG